MITYKYKLYRTHRTKYLDDMLREACFVWNHALALQKRYYRIYHDYISLSRMQHLFAKRIKRNILSCANVQEILQRLDNSYQRFFNHLATRTPKFKKPQYFTSIVFKVFCNRKCGRYIDVCGIDGNVIHFNIINKSYKFNKSRDYEGTFKRVILKRNTLGEYFICVVTDAEANSYGKTRKGASVGADFGLKHYLTLSDGTTIDNPQFLKKNLLKLRRLSRNLSKCKKVSNNRNRKIKELERFYDDVCNKRDDFQWKLAHELCRRYDKIFIEDLDIEGMGRRWGRKVYDLAHGFFVKKLFLVASKYGVVVHKIDRYYPSSKTCTCGYINKELKLTDRVWTCPHCGATHDRDLLAANNILRQGIVELESVSKTSKHSAKRQSRSHPKISPI